MMPVSSQFCRSTVMEFKTVIHCASGGLEKERLVLRGTGPRSDGEWARSLIHLGNNSCSHLPFGHSRLASICLSFRAISPVTLHYSGIRVVVVLKQTLIWFIFLHVLLLYNNIIFSPNCSVFIGAVITS